MGCEGVGCVLGREEFQHHFEDLIFRNIDISDNKTLGTRVLPTCLEPLVWVWI